MLLLCGTTGMAAPAHWQGCPSSWWRQCLLLLVMRVATLHLRLMIYMVSDTLHVLRCKLKSLQRHAGEPGLSSIYAKWCAPVADFQAHSWHTRVCRA